MDGGPYVIERLDDPVYEKLDQLEGVTLYHERPWHRLLERTFDWRVQALVDYDRDGGLTLFLPFVEKRRLGRKIHVSLPLSHRIGPAFKPGYHFRFPDWLTPFEAHADLPGLQPHTEHVVTELELTRFRSTVAADIDVVAILGGDQADVFALGLSTFAYAAGNGHLQLMRSAETSMASWPTTPRPASSFAATSTTSSIRTPSRPF